MVSSQQNSTEDKSNESTAKDTESIPDQASDPDLADRLKEVDGVSDGVAEQLAQNWQRLLGIIVVVVLVVWAVNGYQKGRQKMLDEAAFGFVQAQTVFAELPKADTPPAEQSDGSEDPAVEGEVKPVTAEAEAVVDEKSDKLLSSERAFNDTMGLLASNSASGVYSRLALVYQAAAKARAGEYQEALSQLNTFPLASFDSAAQTLAAVEISQEQFINEIAALMSLKIQLLQDADNLDRVWPRLLGLARSSQLVSVEALLTALRISSEPAKREAVIALAQELARIRPAYRDLIQSELQQYGVTLDQPVQESA